MVHAHQILFILHVPYGDGYTLHTHSQLEWKTRNAVQCVCSERFKDRIRKKNRHKRNENRTGIHLRRDLHTPLLLTKCSPFNLIYAHTLHTSILIHTYMQVVQTDLQMQN